MPDPEAGSFNVRTPKSSPVPVGERLKMGLTPDTELRFRIQCIERVISRIPIVGQDYNRELQRTGLKKLDMKLPRGFE